MSLPSSCANLAPGVLNGDAKTGSVSCSVTLPEDSYTIYTTVGSTDAAAGSNAYKATVTSIGTVQVSSSNGSYITGGGYLVQTASYGQYAAGAGTRANFGFNVKYTKSGTQPQGRINVIFRKDGRTYQIRSNSIATFGTSLYAVPGTAGCKTLTPSSTCIGYADFKGKATLQDVTNPLAPISLGGNLDFQFTLTDKGEPGTYDEVGISLSNGSILYFSSNWASSQTVKQVIAGGNVVVH